jgi:phosphatidylinositol 3-kinase
VEKLLPLWGNDVGIDDALELLGPGFTNSKVRAFAVKRLGKADDEVSILVPLQVPMSW